METKNNGQTVLVTGGSGFIASYCILSLLDAGYQVRASLRSMQRADELKAMLAQGGTRSFENLSFVEADLDNAASWTEAVKGCTYVVHTASPTPNTHAKTDDDFVIPAVNGVLFLMRAARDAGVKRFVLTSAIGAVAFGSNKTAPYTEEDWTVIDDTVASYQKSKTLSERAAWEFIQKEGNGMELSVVNPTGVYGPVLSEKFSHSIQPIYQMLIGGIKACPKISSSYVDVRDVADLHLRAMTMPAANGQRFIASAGDAISMLEVANILRRNMGDKAAKVPTKEIPNWLMRILGIYNKQVASLVPYLGMVKNVSSKKAKTLLGWQPCSTEEAVLATANSLISLGIIK